jgi:hypothetical protein
LSKAAIEILNPLPGGMRYTTRSQYFINMGIAVMCGNKLQFHEENQVRKETLRDVAFWNGSDNPNKMHKPGEVRS